MNELLQIEAVKSLHIEEILWLANGERDCVTERIFSQVTKLSFVKKEKSYCHPECYPRDMSDFRKVRLLFEQCKDIKDYLLSPNIGAEHFEPWQIRNIFSSWDELCASMDEEWPGWKENAAHCMPKTSRLLYKIIETKGYKSCK